MGPEGADNVGLAELELLRQSSAKFARQIGHFVERLDALLIQPVGDLARAVARFAKVMGDFLQLAELERFDIGLPVLDHFGGYGNCPFPAIPPAVRFFVEKCREQTKVAPR